MAQKEFVSQTMLESWLDAGQATFEDNVLRIPERGVSLELTPAVRVATLLDGEDTAQFLGKMCSIASLEAAGAEYFQGSLIVGETAYECEDGYLGTVDTPPPPTAASDEPPAIQTPGAVPPTPSATPPTPTASAPVPGSPPVAPIVVAPAAAAVAPPPQPAETATTTHAAKALAADSAEQVEADSEILADYLLKHLVP